MSIQNILNDVEHLMKKTIDRLHTDFSAVRTGRASPAILDPVRVNYYGSLVPLQQVGTVAVTEARTIEIRPWEANLIQEIEKAIHGANLGVSPNSDGKILRLVFPPLTEDRRKDLVKVVKKLAEDFRVSLRNERRDAIEKIKAAEKNKEITQDFRVQGEERIQGLTNAYIKKVDEILAAKEKEILEI
ncbi:MAG: Ribosome-recycling factor [Elusimicrobia bacterium]|nr:Ribosome-recycling factor [Elusimicrobiota bacterium]